MLRLQKRIELKKDGIDGVDILEYLSSTNCGRPMGIVKLVNELPINQTGFGVILMQNGTAE